MTATISRRQILSRSRDAGLDHLQQFAPYEDYEEMWFSHEHLFKDHIAEVLRKWEQIDDEIWAKMIFMSRNRRIAKAYVRVPAVIIDGSENGFDGYRVGLNGFEDPFRDMHTDKLMQYIEKGCRIGIDDNGNIVIKRYSTSGVFVKSYPSEFGTESCCLGNSVIKARGALEPNKPSVIFDMGKFESAMANELKSAYPDRRRLEQQCIVVVAFVRDHPTSILDLPVYVMLINIVALDLLKSKLNPVIYQSISQPRRQPDPYSHNSHYPNHHQNGTTRITGSRSDSRRVPDFVSIFQPPSHSSRESQYHTEEDDIYDQNGEAIYGQIGVDSDYFGTSGQLPQYQSHRGQRGQPPRTQQDKYNKQTYPNTTLTFNRSKSSSGPFCTLTTPRGPKDLKPQRPSYDRFFADENDSDRSGPRSLKPPKLPPRDKKKLSKQIKAIRSSSEQRSIGKPQSQAGSQQHNQIQIPSPDYLEEEVPRGRGKIWDQRDSNQENIYDTMLSMRPKTKNGTGKAIGKKGTTKSIGPPTGQRLSGYRDIPRSILDEDPYYSGMEARLSSNKRNLLDGDKSKQDRGLYWVVRKVLSSNYINLLTTKRHRRDKSNGSASLGKLSRPSSAIDHHLLSQPTVVRPVAKCKSSSVASIAPPPSIPKSLNDSSTDSDPYASINDVYEPIYGYCSGSGSRPSGGYSHTNNNNNNNSAPFWPTAQRKKHR